MRALVTWLSGTAVVCALACFVPGCGGGASELEKPPETTKALDPMNDMPGFKEQQEKLKAEGKIRK